MRITALASMEQAARLTAHQSSEPVRWPAGVVVRGLWLGLGAAAARLRAARALDCCWGGERPPGWCMVSVSVSDTVCRSAP
jgi:hypothetical protein